MQEIWHILRWEWTVIFGVYVFFQFLASKRLLGKRKQHSQTVMIAMLIAFMVSDWVHEAFEIPKVSRIAMVIVGLCASIATAFLARLLAEQKLELTRDVSRSGY